MPDYVKIDGLNGSATCGEYKGWFEFLTATIDNLATAVWVKKRPDKDSLLLDTYFTTPRDVTIVWVTNASASRVGRPASPREVLRIRLTQALIDRHQVGGNSRPDEFFRFNGTKIILENGSPAHAKLVLRSQDWGTLKASAHFGQTAAVA